MTRNIPSGFSYDGAAQIADCSSLYGGPDKSSGSIGSEQGETAHGKTSFITDYLRYRTALLNDSRISGPSDTRRQSIAGRLVATHLRSLFVIGQMACDVLIYSVLSALVVICQANAHQHDHYIYLNFRLYISATVIAVVILVISFANSGIYDPLRTCHSAEVLGTTARRVFEVMFLLTGCFFVLKISDNFSRFWLLGWSVTSVIMLCGFRLIGVHTAQRLVRSGKLTKHVAIVGATEVAERLAARFAQAGSGTNLAGIFDQAPSQIAQLPVQPIEMLENLAASGRIDEIIIAIPPSDGRKIAEFCRRFHPYPVALRILVPRDFEYFQVLESRRYGETSTFLVVRKPFDDVGGIVKWLEDKIIAALCLLAASPLFLLIALAIKLGSRGPVFFRQKRFGANNRTFNLLKFRSMYVDQADSLGQQLTRSGDPRVTHVGRILRSTSLDELPQLINVLRGDMSLVGPRPHALAARAGDILYVDAALDYPLRHRVKPGMTGWAQVNGWRGETTRLEQLQGRLEHDLYYVHNWSLAFDLLILGRTLFAVLSRQNAV